LLQAAACLATCGDRTCCKASGGGGCSAAAGLAEREWRRCCQRRHGCCSRRRRLLPAAAGLATNGGCTCSKGMAELLPWYTEALLLGFIGVSAKIRRLRRQQRERRRSISGLLSIFGSCSSAGARWAYGDEDGISFSFLLPASSRGACGWRGPPTWCGKVFGACIRSDGRALWFDTYLAAREAEDPVF
jgi:hypothetical protein